MLTAIAARQPLQVVNFIGKRLKKKSLSRIPDELVDAVASWYDGKYGAFIYRGAKLVSNTFPDFPETLQHKLLSLAKSGDKDKLMVVLAILRNYDSDHSLYPICKELVKIIHPDKTLLNEIAAIFISTGVVQGEYGLANAWEERLAWVQEWLNDSDSRVCDFAKEFSASLTKDIDQEKKRTSKEIARRKQQFDD